MDKGFLVNSLARQSTRVFPLNLIKSFISRRLQIVFELIIPSWKLRSIEIKCSQLPCNFSARARAIFFLPSLLGPKKLNHISTLRHGPWVFYFLSPALSVSAPNGVFRYKLSEFSHMLLFRQCFNVKLTRVLIWQVCIVQRVNWPIKQFRKCLGNQFKFQGLQGHFSLLVTRKSSLNVFGVLDFVKLPIVYKI